jgi:hypothetical protein
MKDYYKFLDLPRTSNSSEIKRAIKAKESALKAEKSRGVNKFITKALEELGEAANSLLDKDFRFEYDLQLEDASPGDLAKTVELPRKFDYSKHRLSDAISWKKYVTGWDTPSVDIYRQLLRQIIILPFPDIQENIILATLLTPTPLATMLPILFSWGAPATGKSNIGKLAAQIYGNVPLGSTTTASAFNRILQGYKFDSFGTELPHMLVIDDINRSILAGSETLQQYLRSGYNRSTDKIAKAKADTDDQVEYSHVFGGRVLSSCYPFFTDPDFAEISRRMLVIECRKSDLSIDMIEPDIIDWTGFKEVRDQLWESEKMCKKFGEYRRAVSSYAIRNQLPRPDKIALVKDVLASGIALGLWGTAGEALDEYQAFLDSQETLIRDRGDIVARTIRRIAESTASEQTAHGIKPRIDPSSLKQIVESYIRSGVFDSSISMKHVNQVMRNCGWELVNDGDGFEWRIG